METIIDNLKLEMKEKISNVEYKQLLEDANMDAVSIECPIITIGAIKEYLIHLIKKFYPTYTYTDAKWEGFFQNKLVRYEITKKTQIGNFFQTNKDSRFEGFFVSYGEPGNWESMCWVETPIKNFVGRPPVHVLKSIKEKKHLFDKIVVVTLDKNLVNFVKDPLVCGLKKDDNNRYLIDW